MSVRSSLKPGISRSINTRENLRPTVHYLFSTTWKRFQSTMAPILQRGRDAASGPPYDGTHRVMRVTILEEKSTQGVPYASVSYGPLLFALPIPDTTNANTPDLGRSCQGGALRKASQEADAIFVNAGSIGRDAANIARSERSFTHDGVAGHPGDKGMKALADAIVQAVLK